MADLIQQLRETTAFIQQHYPHTPEAGIVLGSGLGNFANEMEVEKEIPYANIPHFPVSTVEGHSGKLLFGKLNGRRVVAMAGRFHFYEGYTAEQVTYPIRTMKFLGIQHLLISNAAGGVNPNFRVGDLMLITDHISLAIINPLLGKNHGDLGPRFPDMSEPYSKALQQKVKNIADSLQVPLQQGVYFGVTGPTFETRAEYKMIHALGGDAVGMSTVQEVIVAIHMGLPVVAISIITDLGIREEDNVITHQEVLEAAAAAEPKLSAIFKQLVAAL
ncbi:purine-nucleoside phosphorylase [Paraflavitalea sp. CAU 1676]|uniref:purine-nucleoside phosphorylase n=1 Tax=Paraflavitalea sp. CAU 1676 TaxID=3032598 RepID=UPI0023DB67CB|nr:purine-nucleoside phosphorylase [Paraflavitalea sp. CAU 1676]MDF2190265.1 purine-nucleoside phosphorylase [Paraflavitalea sp. CAU 1676]